MARNFDYLKDLEEFSSLYTVCNKAETFCNSDPSISAHACRWALEWTVKMVYRKEAWGYTKETDLLTLLNKNRFKAFIKDERTGKNVDFVRRVGNRASHPESDIVTTQDSHYALKDVYRFIGDVLRYYGYISRYPFFDEKLIPQKVRIVIDDPSDEEAERDLVVAANHARPISSSFSDVIDEHNPENLSEAELNRRYIDEMLREAGWKISDTSHSIIRGMACKDVKLHGKPGENYYADYVLFDTDGQPLAVIESKHSATDLDKGKSFADKYATCLLRMYGVMPVVYYTNGYEVNVCDGLGYPPRTIYGFHSLQDLRKLFQKRGYRDIKDMIPNENIINRNYQIRAVKRVCEHLNAKHRKALLVMATGTGKTRVSIALVEVLLRNNWVKNVLFLADRTTLVEQAYVRFNTHLPHETKCNLCDSRQNRNVDARILFSTYQTMINLIDTEEKTFSVGRFDLIIIDEAHRSVFGRYGVIFDYFDSLLVGLTATPREGIDRSTYKLLELEEGEPTDYYEYEQAVADRHLVDFQAYRYDSDILKNGIKYNDRSEEEKKQLDTIFESDSVEEKNIDSNEIFRYVCNTATIDKVLQELMEKGLRVNSGEKIGKTIIFAYNHKHAVKIAERFNVLYPQLGTHYCKVIDYHAPQRQHLLDEFEDADREPRIAVSVDMLDTGIDIPEILNLVFFKPVHSKIKFDQMKGRGTRLCKNLLGPGEDKKLFYIFDFCNNFDFFDENPKGVVSLRQRTLTERVFIQKVNLVMLLQAYATTDYDHQFHSELKKELYDQLANGLGFERISVRKHCKEIEPFLEENKWEEITETDLKVLKDIIVPLLLSSGDDLAMKMDALFYECELSYLKKGVKSSSEYDKIACICNYLKSEKSNLPQVMRQMSVIYFVLDANYWSKATLEDMEHDRKALRQLMRFAMGYNDSPIIDIDVVDEIGLSRVDKAKALIVIYRQRVDGYVTEHKNDVLLQKIYNLEQLSEQDVHQLEHILWEELGTRQQYDDYIQMENKTCGSNVVALIRSLCGVNRTKAHQLFVKALGTDHLTSMQEEYLNSIIDYVTTNGDIERRTLGQEPYRNLDWEQAFGDKRTNVGNFVEHLHHIIKIPVPK